MLRRATALKRICDRQRVQNAVIVYPLTTYCSTGLVIAAEFDVSSNVTLTCKGTSNSA